MNMKQAKYVRVIAEEGSVTAAAKKLFLSQPTLSQMLRQAEEDLGLPIFHRKSSPLRLTYAGERYLQTAALIEDACDRLETQVRMLKAEDSGRLRLGISIQRAAQILPRVFPWFLSKYPNVAVELIEEGSARLEELAIQGQVDLALAAVEAASPQLTYQLIEPEVIGIIAGRGTHLASSVPAGTPIRLEQAAEDAFIAIKPGHSIRVVQDKLFRLYGLHPHVLLETESVVIGRGVALSSDACMLCSNIYVDEQVQTQGAFYPLKDYENHRHFYACCRKEAPLPKYAQELIRIVCMSLR